MSYLFHMTRSELIAKYQLRLLELETEKVRHPEWTTSIEQEQVIYQEVLQHLHTHTLGECADWAYSFHLSVDKDTWHIYHRISDDCLDAVEDPEKGDEG